MDFLMFDAHCDHPERVAEVDLLAVFKGHLVIDNVVYYVSDFVSEDFHLWKGRP